MSSMSVKRLDFEEELCSVLIHPDEKKGKKTSREGVTTLQ